MMMKIFVPLACLLLYSTSIFISIQEDETFIPWNSEKKLVWSDFQDKPDRSTDVVALTASAIIFEYSVNTTNDEITGYQANVLARFYPEKSWVKKDEATDHILKHEQLHFDITELHARKLRKSLSELEINQDLIQDINRLHQENNVNWAAMEKRYDQETDCSRDKNMQLQWEKNIHEQLLNLQAFQ